MFAILANPVVDMLCWKHDNMYSSVNSDMPRSVVRACADDIGGVFTSLRPLRTLEIDFMTIERATGLFLGLGKCVCIPLCPFDPLLQKIIK